MLTETQIQSLARRQGVRRIAVENFLSTLSGLTQMEARANLALDARSYKWNGPTQQAIRRGIEIFYSREA